MERPTKYCHACGARIDAEAEVCPKCGVHQPKPMLMGGARDAALRSGLSETFATKLAAGLCGILLGAFGVHKFVLGLEGPGLTMLLVTLLTTSLTISAVSIVPAIGSMLMGLVGFVEGILYLTKSDEEFHQRYIVEKQVWF
jgi:TM2 domain-containing membrane protein YozV